MPSNWTISHCRSFSCPEQCHFHLHRIGSRHHLWLFNWILVRSRPHLGTLYESDRLCHLQKQGCECRVIQSSLNLLIPNFYYSQNVQLRKLGLPKLLDTTDLLIKVRAASINRLDERISRGYGRTLRCIIQRYHDKYYPELPLTLGRACAGIVEAVGKESRSGLEIGDEVWCVAPFYENGLASEMVVVSESRISRKPVMTGFEGAASLPYSGCIALNALQEAGIFEQDLTGQQVLIQDGCSPVGCVLMQLCKHKGATITATCDVRSVPVVKALGEFPLRFLLIYCQWENGVTFPIIIKRVCPFFPLP